MLQLTNRIVPNVSLIVSLVMMEQLVSLVCQASHIFWHLPMFVQLVYQTALFVHQPPHVKQVDVL